MPIGYLGPVFVFLTAKEAVRHGRHIDAFSAPGLAMTSCPHWRRTQPCSCSPRQVRHDREPPAWRRQPETAPHWTTADSTNLCPCLHTQRTFTGDEAGMSLGPNRFSSSHMSRTSGCLAATVVSGFGARRERPNCVRTSGVSAGQSSSAFTMPPSKVFRICLFEGC